jgi:tRNA (uracil-5-)-methyltransferase TRM9
MMYRKDLRFEGCDISDEFIKICLERHLQVIIGNILQLPFTDNYFEYSICIAVIHHLQERTDRIKAIRELLRVTQKQTLIYVWCFEQPIESKRQFKTQDEMVPFQLKNGEVHYRYYHLYIDGELENEVIEAGGKIEKIYVERGNYVAVINK